MLAACWLSSASRASSIPDSYDRAIKAAAGRWMPGVDWRLLKAQYWQESRLDPFAVSPAGAQGIAQFMPATWAETSKALRFGGVAAFSARHAIDAGAYYMSKQRRAWYSPRPERDRHSLALASYNAGLGNIAKAQRLCMGAIPYDAIIACLPDVTGHHAQETMTYVPRIWGYYHKLKIGF